MTTNIEIDPELQAWIPALSADEYAGLEASILAEGCRDPLVVWGNCLLDGHNRHAICKKHGIAFQTFEKTGLKTKADAKIWMIENQLGKRNTNDFTRVALALKLKPLIEERAQQRMLAGKADPSLKSDEGSTRTDQTIATAAGVGKDTVRNVEKIIAHATPEVIAKVQSGEMTIHKAAQTVAPAKPAKPAKPGNVQPAANAPATVVAPAEPEPFDPGRPAILGDNDLSKDVISHEEEPAALQGIIDSLNEELETLAAACPETDQGAELEEQIRMRFASALKAAAAYPAAPDPELAIPAGMILVDAEEYEQIIADAKHTLADNEMMGRVFDADDRMAAMMAEAKRQAAIADAAERSLFAKSGEFVERARAVVYWKNRAEKAEKALARLQPAQAGAAR